MSNPDPYEGRTDADHLHTEAELDAIGARLAEIFNLQRDPEHKDRWRVEGGNKTNIGLARTFLRLAEEIEDGTPGHKLFH